jgi:hypothetical protein
MTVLHAIENRYKTNLSGRFLRWKLLKFSSWIAVISLAWTAGYIYQMYFPQGEMGWVCSIYRQKIQKARNVESSGRLLIVGGSGTHFSVDAKKLTQTLGIPVFNMGLHGSLGLDAIIASTVDEIHKGDVVLLIPEYHLLWDDDGVDRMAAGFGVRIGHPSFGKVNSEEIAQEAMLAGNPTLRSLTGSFLEVIRNQKSVQYYSDELNAYGDPVELKIRNTNLQAMEIKGQISKYASWRLKQFRKQVEASGASLIIGLPWTFATEDDKVVRNVQEVVEELTKIAPLLYEPDSLNLKTDRTLFGDSVYHLGYKGRKLRSLELSQQLKPLLAGQKNRKGTEIISTNQSQTSLHLEKYPQ